MSRGRDTVARLRAAARGRRDARRWLRDTWALAETLELDRVPGQIPKPRDRPAPPTAPGSKA